MGSLALFSAGYFTYLKKAKKSENEILRMGAAGSIVVLLNETTFYFLDTVNCKSKVEQESISFLKLINETIKREGTTALYRGFSSTFFGSIVYGFFYFHFYPFFKTTFHTVFEKRNALPALYFLSGCISDFLSLLIYYPFETIKVRYQTKHSHYQYEGLLPAFKHLLFQEGPRKFYRGWLPYALNYTVNYSIQITIYEMMMSRMKAAGITKDDKMNELAYILASSCTGGLIGSGLSNGFEVIAV